VDVPGDRPAVTSVSIVAFTLGGGGNSDKAHAAGGAVAGLAG